MLDSLHVFCQKTENQLNWLKIINYKCVGVREVQIFLKLRIFISSLWVRIEMLLCLRYYRNIKFYIIGEFVTLIRHIATHL